MFIYVMYKLYLFSYHLNWCSLLILCGSFRLIDNDPRSTSRLLNWWGNDRDIEPRDRYTTRSHIHLWRRNYWCVPLSDVMPFDAHFQLFNLDNRPHHPDSCGKMRSILWMAELRSVLTSMWHECKGIEMAWTSL